MVDNLFPGYRILVFISVVVVVRVLIACEYSGRVRDAFQEKGHDAWSCDLLPTDTYENDGYGKHYQGDVFDIIDGWIPVAHAHDMLMCDMCEEPFCPECHKHYFECDHPGPMQDDEYEYKTVNGVELARPKENPHWDLMIAHPPCTYLTGAAEWAFDDKPMINGVPRKMKEGTLIGAERRQARLDALIFVDKLWAAPINKICIENPVGVITKNLPWMGKPQYINQYWFGEDASKKTGLWLNNLEPLKPTDMIEPRFVDGKPRWGNQTDSGQNKLPPSKDRWKIRSTTPLGIAKAMADQWGIYEK